jgi:hypothetical protein
MSWCEENGVEYVFGLARNVRLQRALGAQLREAKLEAKRTGKSARVFRDFRYRTRTSWSRQRRVVGKAEHLGDKPNPRFIVTSLDPKEWPAKKLYEKLYCARGEMENRIKEAQLELFADRTSSHTFKANQLRIWLSSFAYVLIEAVRRIGLRKTAFAVDGRLDPPEAHQDRRVDHHQRAARKGGDERSGSASRGVYRRLPGLGRRGARVAPPPRTRKLNPRNRRTALTSRAAPRYGRNQLDQSAARRSGHPRALAAAAPRKCQLKRSGCEKSGLVGQRYRQY